MLGISSAGGRACVVSRRFSFVYDRNPQKHVENIFEANASDFEAHEHGVYRTRAYPSHIALSVLP